jgi:hypothetical protein
VDGFEVTASWFAVIVILSFFVPKGFITLGIPIGSVSTFHSLGPSISFLSMVHIKHSLHGRLGSRVLKFRRRRFLCALGLVDWIGLFLFFVTMKI